VADAAQGVVRARVFYALWPSAALAGRMAAHARRLEAVLDGRASRTATLHLTLAFLGEVDAGRLPVLAAPPPTVTTPRFELRLDRCGAWPDNGIGWLAPSVIPEPLAGLQQRLALWVESLGFALEKRAFRPHVTVVRKSARRMAESAIEPLLWPVEDWVLVRSRLSPGGAGYEPLARFALEAGQAG
jgi:2'-5' RNA ligase